MEKKPTYIDLFAGCGGLSLGLHNAGWKGLFAIEKSPDAFETLEYNLINKKSHFDWPDWLPQQSHDINDVLKNHKVQLANLRGEVDMVVGGPPCQGFSTAGRRKEDDVRNGLIRSYLRFIMHVRPKLIFFENVKGFTQKFEKNKSKGIAYSSYVKRVLNWFGYEVDGKMVDFSKYGIPQKRTRFILVAVRRDVIQDEATVAQLFFNPILEGVRDFLTDRKLPLKANLKQALSDLFYANGQVPCKDRDNFKAGVYGKLSSGYQRYMRSGVSDEELDSHSFPKHKPETIEKFRRILEVGERNKSLSKSVRQELGINKHVTIPLDASKPSPTLTTLPDDYVHYGEPRILTVREYARIQSFPDCYKFRRKYTTGGKERVNQVPRYSQIGNAIPPLFGEQAGFCLKRIIE
ncbi:DNA cytosine methyltransferase [Algoriphagus litoralis]|uniref:DNA cytosine methyltransferase n=1 Tax=Algoriphagus litoralis TaxID=2202829 RepID=UPI000DBA83F8|nr:DNA cytosine methyltransferase [Algoriphagus litoralis]